MDHAAVRSHSGPDSPQVNLHGLLRAGAIRFDAGLSMLSVAVLLAFFPLRTIPLILLVSACLCFWSSRRQTGQAMAFIRRHLKRIAALPDARHLQKAQPVLALFISVSVLMTNIILLRMVGGIADPRTQAIPGQTGQFEIVSPWVGPEILALLDDGLLWLSVAGIAAMIHFRIAYMNAYRRLQMADLMEEVRNVRSRRFESDYSDQGTPSPARRFTET